MHFSFIGNCYTILLLLLNSVVYWIYQCRTSVRCNLLLFDFIAHGGFRKPYSFNEYFRNEGGSNLCACGSVYCCNRGTLIEKLHMEKYVEDFILKANAVDIDSPTLTQRDRLIYAKEQVVSTFKKVFLYILIGVAIDAVIHNWIPEKWIENVLGSHNPFGVVLATLVGIPMYADIFGTILVAEALLAKGAQLGTILSFMMAVTTLSLPSMIMLKKAVKTELLGVFVAICTIGIIVIGYLFNLFQNFII